MPTRCCECVVRRQLARALLGLVVTDQPTHKILHAQALAGLSSFQIDDCNNISTSICMTKDVPGPGVGIAFEAHCKVRGVTQCNAFVSYIYMAFCST